MEIDRDDAQEFVRQTNSVLGAVSRALEQLAFGESPFESQSIQDAYLQLQKISFQFKAQCGRLLSKREFDEAVAKLYENLSRYREQIEIGTLRSLRVRVSRLTQRARLGFLHPGLANPQTLPAVEVIYLLETSLRAAIDEEPFRVERDIDDKISATDIETVKKSIPGQRIAPAQFEISEGMLRVRAQPRTPKKDAELVASQSFDALLEQGLEIQQALEAGNCDRRLSEKVKEVNETLKSKENIIKLGLQNMTCGAMAKALSDELSDAVAAQIDGFCAGLAMYIAQFDEWQTFVQNAAEAAISENNTEELRNFADALLKEVSGFKEAIDPEVPRTIRFLVDLLDDPKKISKRAVFAFIRTIENLIIESFTYLISTVYETAEKTKTKVSDKGSTYLARALVAVGLVSAAGLMPVSAQVKGMEWIEAAYHVVKEQIAPKIGGF